MVDAADWEQRDDYYWAGPGGWAICRVFVDRRWQYELWVVNGTRHGMELSLAGPSSFTARSSRLDRLYRFDGIRKLILRVAHFLAHWVPGESCLGQAFAE